MATFFCDVNKQLFKNLPYLFSLLVYIYIYIYHTILYHTIPYHTILCHAIQYHTIPSGSSAASCKYAMGCIMVGIDEVDIFWQSWH